MVTKLVMLENISKDLIDAMISVFGEGTYVTKAIMLSFKNNKDWDESKRGIFSDSVYDIVRYWRLLWYLLGKKPTLDKNDLRQLIGVYLFYKGQINTQNEDLIEKLNYAKKVRVLRESIPDWLDRVGTNEIGERWDSVISSLNEKPVTFVRANTLKTTKDDLLKILKKEGISSKKVEWSPGALLLVDRTNVFRLQSFKDGFFEVQNASSQIVSLFLDPRPGMMVIDACAGEGSKALHLAAIMKNRGKIIAMDNQEWKLKELRRRAARAGADNIETRVIDSSKAYKRLEERADRVLLDVPCSGFGTLRRNPDTKWKLNPGDLERLKALQRDLLSRYCSILKVGGRFVYSVCSILPSEGEEQIQDFIKEEGGKFNLIKERRYWPDIEGADGFYMALIERK